MKQGKEGSEKEEKTESKKEAMKEGDIRKGKVVIRIRAGSMMPHALPSLPERDPVVRIEKAKKGFIVSCDVKGKEQKEFAKNLMSTPSILRKIFGGNKSYNQTKEMVDEDYPDDGTESA